MRNWILKSIGAVTKKEFEALKKEVERLKKILRNSER